MSALKDKRDEIRTALTDADFFAFSTVPEVAAPPLVYVAPNEPYVSLDGATFGGVIVHHQIVIVAAPGVNEQRADELDDLVEGVLAVVGPRVDTFEVGRPGQLTFNGQPHIGVAIDTTTEIRLETP